MFVSLIVAIRSPLVSHSILKQNNLSPPFFCCFVNFTRLYLYWEHLNQIAFVMVDEVDLMIHQLLANLVHHELNHSEFAKLYIY